MIGRNPQQHIGPCRQRHHIRSVRFPFVKHRDLVAFRLKRIGPVGLSRVPPPGVANDPDP
jgi:hypothetical protein